MSISVVLITLDEEQNIGGAIESVAAVCDDIVVLDSFSTDRTCDIAERLGARVFKRCFDGYASQRNAALALPLKHEWILMLDADERVTKELWDEMIAAVSRSSPSLALFRVRRKDIFFGRWLRRSSGYPTWFGRLVRRGRVNVAREINEEYQADGDVAYLENHIIHFPFNRGLPHWIERHNRYSTMEAKIAAERLQMKLRDLFAHDPVARRRAQKALSFRIPGRPLLVFAYLYLFRLGFMDGLPGFRFCVLRSIYEYFIDLKIAEIAANETMRATRLR